MIARSVAGKVRTNLFTMIEIADPQCAIGGSCTPKMGIADVDTTLADATGSAITSHMDIYNTPGQILHMLRVKDAQERAFSRLDGFMGSTQPTMDNYGLEYANLRRYIDGLVQRSDNALHFIERQDIDPNNYSIDKLKNVSKMVRPFILYMKQGLTQCVADDAEVDVFGFALQDRTLKSVDSALTKSIVDEVNDMSITSLLQQAYLTAEAMQRPPEEEVGIIPAEHLIASALCKRLVEDLAQDLGVDLGRGSGPGGAGEDN